MSKRSILIRRLRSLGDEVELGEGANLFRDDTRLTLEGEGLERPLLGQPGGVDPPGESGLLAMVILGAEEPGEEGAVGELLLLGVLDLVVEDLGHPPEVEVAEELIDLVSHRRPCPFRQGGRSSPWRWC